MFATGTSRKCSTPLIYSKFSVANPAKMRFSGQILFSSLVLFISFVKQGDSLRCWTCAADMDAPCADYFNISKIMRNQIYQVNQDVQLLECPPFSPENRYNYDQKVVCMKKKQTTHGRSHYIRQCSYIRADDSVGTCPTESIGSITMINFCEYCDSDGCNGSSALQTTFFLSAILPVLAFVTLWK